MNDKYVDVSEACSGTYAYNIRLDPRLRELLQDHKSTWEANSKGGEPNWRKE